MPAAIAIPLITAAAGAGASITSGALQSRAAGRATRAQSAANDAALSYTQQKDAQDRADALAAERANYGQYTRNQEILRPSQEARIGATQKLSHLLGLPDVAVPAPPPMPEYLRGSPASTPISSLAGGAPTPQAMVTMRAPNGQTRQVPADQAAHYQAAGAEVIR